MALVHVQVNVQDQVAVRDYLERSIRQMEARAAGALLNKDLAAWTRADAGRLAYQVTLYALFGEGSKHGQG